MNQQLELSYGHSKIPFEYDDARFTVIGQKTETKPLSDIELGRLFDRPFESERIEDIIGADKTVLIAVPDATRDVGTGQIINLLVRRLISTGTMPYDISVIFATGLHRPVTADERKQILTPFIEQRVKAFDHNPSDIGAFLNLGETRSGIPIELNRKLVEADHVILIGGVGFHYFAGFTGGRKLVCPGLASKRTITGTHSLAFDTNKRERAVGVGTGKLNDNPVHEAFVEIVAHIDPSFCFNTSVNDQGHVTDLVCGDWKASHEEACKRHIERYTAALPEKREMVIVSVGGAPFDINMVQAHKAIETASYACRQGGTIIVLAECPDGAGSAEFEKWFERGSSVDLGVRLSEKYSVGGQTAWSLRRKAEEFNINIVTKLPETLTQKMGLRKFPDFAHALAGSAPTENGYIIPYGARFLPVLQ